MLILFLVAFMMMVLSIDLLPQSHHDGRLRHDQANGGNKFCDSSSFLLPPETPLFVKWEHFMEKTHNLYFIQVGANIGKNVGGGDPVWEYVRPCHWSGVAIEPMPETYATLKNNYHDLEALNQIVTLNLGVSDSSGYTKMLGGGETASLSTEIKQEKEGTMMVEVVTLKQLWERVKYHIPSTGVDILVLDVEGNEQNILAKDHLPHPLPTRILFEIAHITQEGRDIIDAKLRSQGYRQSADLIHRDAFAISNNLPAQDRLYELIK